MKAMRTIKFRGKRVDTGEWVYGFLFPSFAGNISIGSKSGFCVEVHPETVGQFIGEVCGVNLWEGDVVKINNLKTDWRLEPHFDWRIFQIEWNRFVWAYNNNVLYMPLRESDKDYTYEYDLTVLGNIHDNPELIKEDEK